jgi:hypothetical protein
MHQIIRRGAISVATTALLVTGVIGMSPTPASADTEVPSGPYGYVGQSVDGSSTVRGTWVFTPCGPACTVADSADTPARHWEFHFDNGRWAFAGSDSIACPAGGAPMERNMNASFDAVTLAGELHGVQTTACGPFPAGSPMPAWTFQLTKGG